jgi:hypothetical protein
MSIPPRAAFTLRGSLVNPIKEVQQITRLENEIVEL